MRSFTDIHTHLLFGVDDGAGNEEIMRAMLDIAYSGGIRRLCLTPHHNLRLFGDNLVRVDAAFSALTDYASGKYPDMRLYLGNELFYTQDSVGDLRRGICRRMSGGKYVLTDFSPGSSFYEIKRGMLDLLNSGYIPILAHAERYDAITSPFKGLIELREFGIPIQINANSLCGGCGAKLRRKSLKIIRAGLADVVASDAHDTALRPPRLDIAAELIASKIGADYADRLLRLNPDRILGNA